MEEGGFSHPLTGKEAEAELTGQQSVCALRLPEGPEGQLGLPDLSPLGTSSPEGAAPFPCTSSHYGVGHSSKPCHLHDSSSEQAATSSLTPQHSCRLLREVLPR